MESSIREGGQVLVKSVCLDCEHEIIEDNIPEKCPRCGYGGMWITNAIKTSTKNDK